MITLPSGTRISPPWPIRALNRLGKPLRALGLFPSLSDEAHFQRIEQRAGRSCTDPFVATARATRIASYEHDADLTLFGTFAIRDQLLKSYSHALAFEGLLAAHPEIAEEPITKPLFVLGWPRTGTTMMQRLLSLHRDARFTPVWEGYCPLPEEGGKSMSVAQRRHKAAQALRLLRWLAPDMNAIHPMACDDPDECFHLFRNYSAMPPGWDFAHLPGYWKWFSQQPPENAYRLHKKQLQALQWCERGGHWVLKSPQHLSGLPGLFAVYPDARLVITHRDAAECVASYCSLVAVAWGMTSDNHDPARIRDYVLSTMEQAQRIARETLKRIPFRQVVHVDYKDFVRNPLDTILGIYDGFGYPHDPALADKVRAWLVANPKDRHGRHAYDLADFGLSAERVHEVLGTEEIANKPAAV